LLRFPSSTHGNSFAELGRVVVVRLTWKLVEMIDGIDLTDYEMRQVLHIPSPPPVV
jgi:hypothetical protein